MQELCATTLTSIVQGQLQLSSLPPLGGAWEPVLNIRLDAALVQPGDVLLSGPGLDERVTGRRQYSEEAFARQAVGVITSHRNTEPWAGTFVVRVPDAGGALSKLAQWNRHQCEGKVVALLGSARGDRIADHLESLLATTLDLQRLMIRPPYDAVNVATALLEIRADADVVLFCVPADGSERAAAASQIFRPDIAANCLKQQRYADLASVRELRLTMPDHGCIITHQPLPALGPVTPDRCRVKRIGAQADCDLTFHLDTPGVHTSFIRLSDVQFGTGPVDVTLEEQMTLLAICLELGIESLALQRLWRGLRKETQHRAA